MTWNEKSNDIETTGQSRILVLCSRERSDYLKEYNGAHLEVPTRKMKSEQVEVLNRVVDSVTSSLELPSAILREVEFLGTPPNSNPQKKHRDSKYNLLTVFLYLNSSLSTWLATKPHLDCGVDIQEVGYYRTNVDKGDVVVNHSMWPHGGPGNEGSEWRYVLFLSYALDAEASRHWTDEQVFWE